MRTELARNVTGYFLVVVGLLALSFGGHFHFDKLTEAGMALVSAALIAFQSKPTGESVPKS